MSQAESESDCPVCHEPITAAHVFVRIAGVRLHVECFFVLKAEGKLPRPSGERARDVA